MLLPNTHVYIENSVAEMTKVEMSKACVHGGLFGFSNLSLISLDQFFYACINVPKNEETSSLIHESLYFNCLGN